MLPPDFCRLFPSSRLRLRIPNFRCCLILVNALEISLQRFSVAKFVDSNLLVPRDLNDAAVAVVEPLFFPVLCALTMPVHRMRSMLDDKCRSMQLSSPWAHNQEQQMQQVRQCSANGQENAQQQLMMLIK